LWRAGKKIRLRLTYPHKDFDRDRAGGNEQIEKIMRIRWENICLPQNPTALPGLQHCLATREEISIVHHLRKRSANHLKDLQADQLPVRLKYFSRIEQSAFALGSQVETDDERIFGVLRQRMENREVFFNIPSLNPDPAEIDVISAFQTDEFVHLTVHGNVDRVQVDDNNVLTQHEILRSFLPPNKPNVRAIILLSCNSASHVSNDILNISAVLHRHTGVPIVIGTTGSIPISAAERFVEGFYKAVGENPNINLEQAVSVGRDSILNEGLNPRNVPPDKMKWDASFGLPRLFLNGADSVLIPLKTLFGPDYKSLYFDEMIERENYFKPLKYDPRDGDWKKVIDWLAKPGRRWFLVTGLAGKSGKSTQLTWLIDYLKNDSASPKIVYHFCQTETTKTVQPLDFVYNSLVPQLIDLYGEPYTNLLRDRIHNGRNPRLIGKEKDALAEFVSEPLTILKENGFIEASDEPIIIIDGIDFVPSDRDLDNTILGLLDSASGRLDQVARILVTAEEDLVTSLNDQNKAKAIADRVFDLTNHADRKPDLKVKDLLVDTPTFFVRVQENLNRPEYKLEAWEDLYGLFDNQVETLEDKYGKIVTRLLDVAAVAYEPLHVHDVATVACFADKINNDRVDEQLPNLLNDIQPFFKKFVLSQQKLIFYHGRFQEYRLLKMNLQHNRSAALTHELFVKAFYPRRGNDWASITDWSTLAETQWYKMSEAKYQKTVLTYQADTMANYVKRYLIDHAYRSYMATAPHEHKTRTRRKEQLLNLICNPGYRTVRYYEIGPRDSIQDLWRGLQVTYKEHLSTLSPKRRNNKETRTAFNRLLAAKQLESNCGQELIKLEASLRRGQTNKSALEAFLF
jgi:hypothetical protein